MWFRGSRSADASPRAPSPCPSSPWRRRLGRAVRDIFLFLPPDVIAGYGVAEREDGGENEMDGGESVCKADFCGETVKT